MKWRPYRTVEYQAETVQMEKKRHYFTKVQKEPGQASAKLSTIVILCKEKMHF